MKWYSADIEARLALTNDYLSGMLDRDKDLEPFFSIHRDPDSGTAFANHAVSIGIPHVTGRALEALFQTEMLTGKPAPKEAEQAYTRYLFSCMDNPDHMPYYTDTGDGDKQKVECHNLREALFGLTRLVQNRSSEKARRLADGMLLTLDRMNGPEGMFSYDRIKSMGREGVFLGISDTMQTTTSGRLVGALVAYYRVTKNPLALRLAGGYARGVMEHSFTEDGRLTDDASNHIHSITSSLSGILDYAYMTGDTAMADKALRVYKNGLREFMSSYGWVKEQAWLETDQGESNQVGDVIEMLLLFAAHKDPAFYAEAERYMRSALLPQQVIDNSFVRDNPEPKGDYQRDMPRRIIGGFGFATPRAHLQQEWSAINTIDITEGAVQAICEFARRIVTRDDLGVRVNLLFDRDCEYARVESSLPVKGQIKIYPKLTDSLLVRIPENIRQGSFRIYGPEGERKYTAVQNYALVGAKKGEEITVRFAPLMTEKGEFIYHKHYGVRYYGEQCVWVSGEGGVYPLFGEFEPEE
ncbi:MAG: hypothetical protein IK083_04745 [Abditibacteriota bacterium]|nr:hypothetical protein [Abditibacteriota bacterium]